MEYEFGDYQRDVNATIKNLQDQGMVLMQFTGLKDKKGKEIWEGDVVKTGEDFIGVVTFVEGEYVVEIPYANAAELSGEYEALWEPKKVLGNIYENPELLK